MAAMLHALDVRDGMRVLEIGTGSGYNAALLSQRLSEDRVTTVEVDAALAERARTALHAAGYRPTVIAGDGALGTCRTRRTTGSSPRLPCPTSQTAGASRPARAR
jgi:protein-L-isoaspartate O-methyltransferase